MRTSAPTKRKGRAAAEPPSVTLFNIGQLSPSIQSKFKGIWNGLRIWLVTGTYKDIEGKVQYYLAPEYALLAASDAENVMEFGQPMDVDCSGPVEIFSKQFKQDDPSGIFTIAESRPLPWPKQPGATVLIDNLQFPAFFFVKKLGYVEAKMGRHPQFF